MIEQLKKNKDLVLAFLLLCLAIGLVFRKVDIIKGSNIPFANIYDNPEDYNSIPIVSNEYPVDLKSFMLDLTIQTTTDGPILDIGGMNLSLAGGIVTLVYNGTSTSIPVVVNPLDIMVLNIIVDINDSNGTVTLRSTQDSDTKFINGISPLGGSKINVQNGVNILLKTPKKLNFYDYSWYIKALVYLNVIIIIMGVTVGIMNQNFFKKYFI